MKPTPSKLRRRPQPGRDRSKFRSKLTASAAPRLSGYERHWNAAREIGKEREHRAVLAFASAGHLPAWFRSIRPGTPEEDHRGIDVVVTTYDLGDIGIQVKGCHRAVREFQAAHVGQLIGIVIVREDDPLPEIGERVMRAVVNVREQMRGRRSA